MFVLSEREFRKARLTLTLVLFNVICFFSFNQNFNFNYFQLLVQINYKIVENNEYWRLMTAMFVHYDVIHLFSNMFGLLIFGTFIESNYKKLNYFILYICSGLFGNVFSLILLPPYTWSLGASGAIFGLIGASFMRLVGDREKILMVFGMIYLLLFLIPSFSPGINVFAHIFGLIFGIIYGYFFEKKRKRILKEIDVY